MVEHGTAMRSGWREVTVNDLPFIQLCFSPKLTDQAVPEGWNISSQIPPEGPERRSFDLGRAQSYPHSRPSLLTPFVLGSFVMATFCNSSSLDGSKLQAASLLEHRLYVR